MNFSKTEQLKKIRSPKKGFRNEADIYDLTTFKSLKAEIKNKELNIKEQLDKNNLTLKQKIVLKKAKLFCEDLSRKFQKNFLLLLTKYRKEKRPISQKIIDYLFEKKLNLPKFTIASNYKASKLLKKFNLDEKIDKNSLLLVFQLPIPLTQFWWKGGSESWGKKSIDINNTVIEWGHFYRKLLPITWEMQDYYEDEKNLNFYRINNLEEHDSKNYYYVWEIYNGQN